MKTSAAELREIAVNNPGECPFTDPGYIPVEPDRSELPARCMRCINSGGEIIELHHFPALHQITYMTLSCLEEVRYRTAVKKSGLMAAETGHRFGSAVLDRHNRELYRSLQAWDLKQPLIIYICSETTPDNPGGNGVGKSYALHALADHTARKGLQPVYVQAVEILAELRASYRRSSNTTEKEILNYYKNAQVLLIDDFGKERFQDPEWAGEKFYYLIDYRLRASLPLVIASNFPLHQVERRFGEGNYGPAIFSRLCDTRLCQQWMLGGPDRRIGREIPGAK